MFRPRAGLAILVAPFFAVALFGQSAEFGRSSGGEVEALTKHPANWSGSLSLSRALGPFAGSAKGYDGSLGGTLLKERLWFFGSAQINNAVRFEPMLSAAPARTIPVSAFGKVTANAGDANAFVATAGRGSNFATLPSSFMTLHYTGLVSNNMVITGTISRDSLRPVQ